MKTIIGMVLLVFAIIIGMDVMKKGEIYLDSALGISTSESSSVTSDEEDVEYVKVTLSGAINKKGTYKIAKDSYLLEAIEEAGGVSDEADTSCFNYYLEVSEDLSIYIAPISDETKICINSADLDELKQLKGIGKTLASRIITYRDENGEFTYLEELLLVEGVGKSIFNNIKDSICL